MSRLISVRKCLSCGRPTPEGDSCQLCGAPLRRARTSTLASAPAPRTGGPRARSAGAQVGTTGVRVAGQKTPTPPAAVAGAVLNIFFPGLGHLIQGRVGAAIFWFFAVIFGYAMFVGLGLALHLLAVVTAARFRGKQPSVSSALRNA
jgi:hypothetical protein